MVIGNILHLCTFTQLNNKKYKYLLLYIYSIVMNKAEKMKVTNTDLLNNRYKYSIDILEQNIMENHLD